MTEEHSRMSPEERRKVQLNARVKFQNWFKTADAIIISARDDRDGQLCDLSIVGAVDGHAVFNFMRDISNAWNPFENASAEPHLEQLVEIDKALQWPYLLQELKEIVSHRTILAYDAVTHMKIVKRAFDIEIQPLCLKKTYAELYAEWDKKDHTWSVFDLLDACEKVGLHSNMIQSAAQSAQLTQKLFEHIGAEKIGHVNAQLPIGEAMMTSEGQVGIAYQHIYNDDLFELENGGWYTAARKPVTKLEVQKCKEI